MKRRSAVGALALTLATGLVLSGCNANPQHSDSATAPVHKGGTLTILSSQSEMNLDPAKSQSLAITSEGLVERRLTTWDISPDKPAKVVPDLATNTGTPSDGGKTWTFTLKKNLQYADGKPITTRDIKYGVERSFAKELSGGLSYHKSLLKGGNSYPGPYSGKQLKSIQTPNARTIVFHLNSAYGDWPWIASMPAFSPVPKAKDNPTKFGFDPEASGPYQVKSYQQGTSMVLKRNPHWSSSTDKVRTAGPNKIVFKLGQDTTVEAQSLISDNQNAKNSFGADFVPPAQLAQVERNPQAKKRLTTSKAGALAYLAMNTQKGALKNVAVRKAIEYAVDKKSYQIASGGKIAGDRASTLITPGIPGRKAYNLYPAPADGNVAKAKSLLKKAGHAHHVTLTLLTKNDTESLAQAQAIQQGLQRAGITVKLKPEQLTSFTADATANKPTYDLVLSSWQPDFPSANGNISPLFDSSQIGGGNYNLSRYKNPAVDKLIASATAEVKPSSAQALWAKADKRIMADAPVVPLIYTKNSFLRGSDVQNFYIGAFPAYPNYLKVSLSK